jgi:PAS domain S-box-containing protein
MEDSSFTDPAPYLPKIRDIAPGDHVSFFYRQGDKYSTVINQCILHAHTLQFRVLFFSQNHSEEEIRSILTAGGVSDEDIGQHIRIFHRSNTEVHSIFKDVSRIVTFLQNEIQIARNDGYEGCFILREIVGVHKVRSTSRMINDTAGMETLLESGRIVLICIYRASEFPAFVLKDVIRTHPKMIIGDEMYNNVFFIPPAESRGHDVDSVELSHWIRTIRELTLSEARLKAGRERYYDLIENSYDMIQSVAPDGRFLFVNREWEKQTGYSGDEARQMRLFEILHPDCLEKCCRTFEKVMSGEDVGLIDATFVTKSGEQLDVQGTVNTKFSGSVPLYTRGIFRIVKK